MAAGRVRLSRLRLNDVARADPSGVGPRKLERPKNPRTNAISGHHGWPVKLLRSPSPTELICLCALEPESPKLAPVRETAHAQTPHV